MRLRLCIGLCLFIVVGVTYALVSEAPARVHLATIAPWFAVAASASIVAWSPKLKTSFRLGLMVAVLLLGSWLNVFSTSVAVMKAEVTIGGYCAFLVASVVLIGLFLIATWLIARVFQ